MKRRPSPRSPAGWFLLCLWLTVFAASSRADGPRALELYEGDSHFLTPYISILTDKEGTLTIEDMLKPETDQRFEPPQEQVRSFGFTTDTKWFKVVLSYPDGAPNRLPVKEWFLEVARIQMNVAELYMVDQKGHIEMQSADMRKPFEKRAIQHVNSVFPVRMHIGHTYTMYLRLAKNTSFYAPVTLWVPEAFIEKNKTEELLYGMFFGGMLVMILYNLFVFYSTGDRNYLRYIGYLTAVTVFEFIDLGHGINLIPGAHQYLNWQILPGVMLCSMIVGLHFARHSLEFPQRHPFLDRCIITWMIVVGINIPSCFLLSYNTIIQGAAFIATISLVIISFLGFYAWWQKNENALFFSLAWSFNLGGFMVLSAMANGLLPPTSTVLSIAPVGVFMEAVMFSFVLAERIKRIERAELEANNRAVDNLKRFRSVFDNASEGIFQMSLKGRLTTANRSFARLLGFPSVQDVVQNTTQVRQMLFPQPLEMLTQLAESGRLQHEIRHTEEHGRERLALLTAQLIRKENGEPSHIEGTVVDYTERMERDRVQKERLRERRERQLARVATDEKSQFLKSMSYEIRTPLAAILGFAELLKVTNREDPERQLAVDVVIGNSHRLLRLINDVLDFSKLEAGKMPLEKIDLSMQALLDHTRNNAQKLAATKGLRLNQDIRYPLPDTIKGDPTRLRQILDNLLTHAIDVSEADTASLSVRWDEASASLIIIVTDTGPALSQRQISRLFRAFDEADTLEGRPATLRSGMDAVIAFQLATLMGGKLTAEPAGESGTRFELRLPLETGPREAWLQSATRAATPAGARGKEAPTLDGSILLAEDNTVNQQLIQRIIRKTGARVIVVGDGQQALEAARNTPFDLILMDVNMPVMGGLEATRHLRTEGYDRPIYALTAEQGEHEIQACLQAGCNGHLGKPIDLERFYAVLAQELSSAGNDLRQTGLH